MSDLKDESEWPDAFVVTSRKLIRDISEKLKLPEDRVKAIFEKIIDEDEKLTEEEREVARELGLGLREAARSTGDVRTFASIEFQDAAEVKGLSALVAKLVDDAARAATSGQLEIDWVLETLNSLISDKETQKQTFHAMAFLLVGGEFLWPGKRLWPWLGTRHRTTE